MLIRSQDKEKIINMTATNRIYVEEVYRANGNLFDISTDETILGHYSTKEKAMKVLDMIQDAYMEYKSGEIVGNGLARSAYTGSYDTKESIAHGIAVLKGYGNEIRKSILFQMPADSEVVV